MNCLIGLLLISGVCQAQWDAESLPAKTVSRFQSLGHDWPKASIVDLLQEFIRILRSSAFPTAYAQNITEQCRSDSLFYVEGLRNLSSWALQMRESTAGSPEGLFAGFNTHAVGLFDECLGVRSPRFQGKYCTAYFYPTAVPAQQDEVPVTSRGNWLSWFQLIRLYLGLNRTVTPLVSDTDYTTTFWPSVGVCIPSSCSASDFRQSVAELVGGFVISNQTIVTASDELNCRVDSDEPPSFDGADIAVLVTLSVLGSVVAIATVYESFRLAAKRPIDDKNETWPIRFLYCFSALNNGRKLLSTKRRPDDLSCLHGIRFLSTTWVVMGHCWIMGSYVYNYTLQLLLKDAYKWEAQAIANATNSVDTFFFLSGFLVAYFLLAELQRNKGRFNVVLFYVHRYLRLTPVYAIIFGFVATLAVYLGDGPGWAMINHTAHGCRSSWWKHFLYINNLVYPRDDTCMGHTWYLNVDMQLFWVSPLLIYPLWRWRKIGLIWNGVVLAASLAANFAVYAVFDLPPVGLVTRPSDADPNYTEYYYNKPWMRAPPYMIGILSGWLLHATKKSKIAMKPAVVIIGWTLAIGTGLALVYGLIPFVDPQEVPEISSAVKMTYGPLNRLAWGIALAWVVVACIHGYGGFINKLLSWKPFMPLGRLTYVAYLIHIVYFSMYYSHARKPMYYTTFDEVQTYFGFLVSVLGLSFIICLCVEGPLLQLEKLVFSSWTSPPAAKPKQIDP